MPPCGRWAASLCRSLLVAGLVDRFRVVVFPVITGATGRDNIYRGYPDVMLELLQTSTADCSCSSTDRRCWTARREPEPPTNETRLGGRDQNAPASLPTMLMHSRTISTRLIRECSSRIAANSRIVALGQ